MHAQLSYNLSLFAAARATTMMSNPSSNVSLFSRKLSPAPGQMMSHHAVSNFLLTEMPIRDWPPSVFLTYMTNCLLA